MKLNHLDLHVSDVAEARSFFETFFGFRCSYVKESNSLVVLEDEDGFVLVVSNLSKVKPEYPPDFHIGFMVNSVEQVRDTYERLKEAGVEMKLNLREIKGNLTFMCYVPGRIPLEVTCRS